MPRGRPSIASKTGAPEYLEAPPDRPHKPRANLTIAERYHRLAFAAECAKHKDAIIQFWFDTMMDEDRDMVHRIVCSKELASRAFGLPIQVSQENVTEHRKQVLVVRWLPPDPNDHSKLIEPEPD